MSDTSPRIQGNINETLRALQVAVTHLPEIAPPTHGTAAAESSGRTTSGSPIDQATLPPAPNISDNVESGWTGVAKTVQAIDERKIKNVQEDVDNILVFAGLYSAVLSSLIATSISSLQPDDKVTIVMLLTQIAVQTHSYAVTPDFLNSTAPPLDVTTLYNSSFEPPLAAKRINILWFASLTLALISASFGILVKQWLREYLSRDQVSSQMQLRIRDFRESGLKEWHVFGIESILPLILQLALALFFVGLCFFTLEIHTSIGYTTIPLVAAWALLFIATAFAPSISPRCPYKIPLLEPLTKRLRKSLHYIPRLAGLSLWLNSPSHRLSVWFYSLSLTEDRVADAEKEDPKILAKIDSAHLDDELLLKICRAAKETFALNDNFNLLMKILLNRSINLPLMPGLGLYPPMLNLTNLPSRTCTILLDSVADALHHEFQRFHPNKRIVWSEWSWNSLMLLFAQLPCMLPERATKVISLCFFDRNGSPTPGIFNRMPPLHQLTMPRDTLILHVITRLRSTFDQFTVSKVYDQLFELFTHYFPPFESLQECFDVNQTTISSDLVQQTCNIFISNTLIAVTKDIPWRGQDDKVLLFLCNVALRLQGHRRDDVYTGLLGLTERMFLRQETMSHFGQFLYSPLTANRTFAAAFELTITESTDSARILNNLGHAFREYISGLDNTPDLEDPAFCSTIIYFLLSQVRSMKIIVQRVTPTTITSVYLPTWHVIMNTVHVALQKVYELPISPADDKIIEKDALHTLLLIDELDTAWSRMGRGRSEVAQDPEYAFDSWARTFTPREGFVSDELVADLAGFLTSEEASQFRRIRRIEHLTRLGQPKLPKLRYVNQRVLPPGPQISWRR
ncbi:hypothetical protein BDW22DRAFT_1363374 [Trametopsis cervina]|nr:hypothetical protein BDW22DRAFT_1363374 [Trametopsis cervina]